MPELIKLYIRSACVGLGLGAVVAVLVLWVSNSVVFGGVQFAYKIMAMAERPSGPRGGTPVGPLQPVRVAAEAKTRRPRR